MADRTAAAPTGGAPDIQPAGDAEPSRDAVIGARIRDLRERAGLTQLELAQKVARSDPWISLIENGKRTASRLTLCRIALALGITVDELLGTGEKVSP